MDTFHIHYGRNTGNTSSFQLLQNREVYFQVFNAPNYTELQLSVMNLIFTKKDFELQLSQILDVVSACFESVSPLLFATGIYELTDYYLEKVNCIQEFPQLLFPQMPLLFFKRGRNLYGYHATGNYRNVSYVVQDCKGVQDIFTSST